MATSTTILDRISAVMRCRNYLYRLNIFGVWAREQRRWDELAAAP